MENSREFSASPVSSCEGQHMVGVSARIQVYRQMAHGSE